MMKKLICLLIGVCTLTSCSNIKKVISRNLDTYVTDCESVKNASVLMPNIKDLGAYFQIKYTYQSTCYSILMDFNSDGLALFVKYDQTIYAIQKEKTLHSYTFLDEPILEFDKYVMPVTEFKYRGYLMKIVLDQEYIDYCACKSFMMIGFDDTNSAIAFLYYYDFDIDYIADIDEDLNYSMRNLVDDAFAWVTF